MFWTGVIIWFAISVAAAGICVMLALVGAGLAEKEMDYVDR